MVVLVAAGVEDALDLAHPGLFYLRGGVGWVGSSGKCFCVLRRMAGPGAAGGRGVYLGAQVAGNRRSCMIALLDTSKGSW